MARIAGVDLPPNKRVEIGLTYIFGLGRTSANKILETAKVGPNTRVKDLSEDDYTDRGGYLRLRLKFDENLFSAAPARDVKKE